MPVQQRHQVIGSDEQHLLLAVVTGDEPDPVAMKHIVHDVRQGRLCGGEVDRRDEWCVHTVMVGRYSQTSQSGPFL